MGQLRAALRFGADAVYGGLRRFGLRASAANFGWEELAEALRLTHGAGKRFYLTLNILPHDEELEARRPEEPMPVLEDERGTYIFSAFDLNMLAHLLEMRASGS